MILVVEVADLALDYELSHRYNKPINPEHCMQLHVGKLSTPLGPLEGNIIFQVKKLKVVFGML